MRYILLFFSFLFFAKCNGQTKRNYCSEKHALDLLLLIPEVKNQEKYIDSLTNHKHGLTMINYDQDTISSKPYYEIHVGFNNEFRYETFFVFRINKHDCSIEVDDPLQGIISLKKWQTSRNKNVNATYSKISLPTSMSEISPLDYSIIEAYKNIEIKGVSATSIIPIESNIVILYFEGDTERWYLATLEGDKIKDDLLIGKRETIETGSQAHDEYIDFSIDIDFNIKLEYSVGANFNERKIQKTENYFLNDETKIIRANER